MTKLLPCVEIEPGVEADSSVVWLHGLGASGHDFEPIVPHLGLPRTRFVFPHAPPRPITINMGLIMPAWYDITRLISAPGQEHDDAVARGAGEPERQVRESAELITALLERERQRGMPASRTVLAGFSQGGALALFTGVRHAQALAGILVLSGYELLPHTRAEASEANRTTALLFCHGTHDPMVDVARGRAACEAYSSAGRDAQWRDFPIEHQVSMDEVKVVADWLRQRLPPS